MGGCCCCEPQVQATLDSSVVWLIGIPNQRQAAAAGTRRWWACCYCVQQANQQACGRETGTRQCWWPLLPRATSESVPRPGSVSPGSKGGKAVDAACGHVEVRGRIRQQLRGPALALSHTQEYGNGPLAAEGSLGGLAGSQEPSSR